MRTSRLATLVIVTGLMTTMHLTSCSSNSSPPTDSGLTGLVTIGPTSPVEREGVADDTPYSATLVIKDVSGDRVATVTSGTDGRFAVDLPPGTYLLEPQSPGVLPFAQPQEVIVEPHRFTEIIVPYDSGIR